MAKIKKKQDQGCNNQELSCKVHLMRFMYLTYVNISNPICLLVSAGLKLSRAHLFCPRSDAVNSHGEN